MPVVRGSQRPAGRKSARPVSGIPVKIVTKNDFTRTYAAHLAQKAAVEKTLARYFELTCGHYGTRELDELMRDWKTKRLEHFCETCNTWKLSKQNFTKGNELPQEPLF